MPRKEDGMLFEVHPSPLKDKNGHNYVYVKPLSGLRYSFDDIEDYCHRNYALQTGELGRAFHVFMEAAKLWLADGYRLETPIGSFAPKIGLIGEKTCADTVNSRDVQLQGIEFVPSKEMMEKMRKWNRGFRCVRNTDTQALMADERHLLQALQRSLSANGGFTNVRSFMMHSALTYHSARKQLDDWCKGEHARLQRTKMGPTYIYTEV